jgi:serine/threonine protein kinase
MKAVIAPPPHLAWWIKLGEPVWTDGSQRSLIFSGSDGIGIWSLNLIQDGRQKEWVTWDCNTNTFAGQPQFLGDAAPTVRKILAARCPRRLGADDKTVLQTLRNAIGISGWCSGRSLRQRMGLTANEDGFRTRLRQLSPRYIRQLWSDVPQDSYSLTTAGLLAIDEKTVQAVVESLLKLFHTKFDQDADFSRFEWKELRDLLAGTSFGDVRMVIDIFNLDGKGGSGSDSDWTWTTPGDIEVLYGLSGYPGFKDLHGRDQFSSRPSQNTPSLLESEWPAWAEEVANAPAVVEATGNPVQIKPHVFKTAFDEYTIVEKIGEGGSGVVHKVRNADGDYFALKVLHEVRGDRKKLKRFKNEIGFCFRFNHRNIVPVVDWGVTSESQDKSNILPFCVMPFFPRTLRMAMKSGIDPAKVMPMFAQILEGVEAAHLRGVVHRDLKPENILVEDERAVVADFGIAHFRKEDQLTIVQTKPRDRLANFQYAAPEQRQMNGEVDFRADIFALGLILNELFTKSIPHGNGHTTIRSVAPDFGFLDLIVGKMLMSNPTERPQSIEEIKLAIDAESNLAFSRQTIAKLLSENEIPAFSATEAISIVSHDYDPKNQVLVAILNDAPSPVWQRAFKSPKDVSGWYGSGPNSTVVNNCIHCKASPIQAPQALASLGRLVDSANRAVLDHQRALAQQEEVRLLEEHRKKIDLERVRLGVLETLKP